MAQREQRGEPRTARSSRVEQEKKKKARTNGRRHGGRPREVCLLARSSCEAPQSEHAPALPPSQLLHGARPRVSITALRRTGKQWADNARAAEHDIVCSPAADGARDDCLTVIPEM
ncbi:hypothetical protein MRX96_028157 [Rhipicephalus microplus]